MFSPTIFTPQKTTEYLGVYQYQNNELQQIVHAEGRVRYSKIQTINGQTAEYYWNYDFFYKDHLGNVRTTVTEQADVSLYKASMETYVSEMEQAKFDNLVQTRYQISKIAGYPQTDAENDKTSKVNGQLNDGMGPTLTLKVMAGDRYDLSCISWYKHNGGQIDNQVDPFQETFSNFLLKSVSILMGTQIPGISVHNNNLASQNFTGFIEPGLVGFLNNQGTDYQNYASQKPKAYLNWLLFDEQFNPVPGPDGSGFEAVGNSEEYKLHVFLNLPIVKSGYLYVWVSNETNNVNVYFDNLTVVHRTGPLLQEDDYYPFGLEMKMLGSKAAGKIENKYQFHKKELQCKEFSDGSGLEWYDFGARMQDPQIGRWFCIDPLAEKYLAFSPYTYTSNNPIKFREVDGRYFVDDKGNRINYTINNDGTIKWKGKNATADLQRIAGDMIKTQAGLSAFKAMGTAKYSIHATIDKEQVIKEDNGSYRFGETKPIGVIHKDAKGNETGRDITKVEIVIYEKAIKEHQLGSEQFRFGNGQTVDIKNLTLENQIGAWSTHEAMHATDRKSNRVTNPNGSYEEREKKPYEEQTKYINEINNSFKPNN